MCSLDVAKRTRLTKSAEGWGCRRRGARWWPCAAPTSMPLACWWAASDTGPDSRHTPAAAGSASATTTIPQSLLKTPTRNKAAINVGMAPKSAADSLRPWLSDCTPAAGCGSAVSACQMRCPSHSVESVLRKNKMAWYGNQFQQICITDVLINSMVIQTELHQNQ